MIRSQVFLYLIKFLYFPQIVNPSCPTMGLCIYWELERPTPQGTAMRLLATMPLLMVGCQTSRWDQSNGLCGSKAGWIWFTPKALFKGFHHWWCWQTWEPVHLSCLGHSIWRYCSAWWYSSRIEGIRIRICYIYDKKSSCDGHSFTLRTRCVAELSSSSNYKLGLSQAELSGYCGWSTSINSKSSSKLGPWLFELWINTGRWCEHQSESIRLSCKSRKWEEKVPLRCWQEFDNAPIQERSERQEHGYSNMVSSTWHVNAGQ